MNTTFVANLTAAKLRYETIAGRQYVVVPVTMIVAGVLNGSRGPLLYPPEEVARNPGQWVAIPITLGHPYGANGKPISATSPGVLQRIGLGALRHPVVMNGKLKAEALFDVAITNRLAPQLLKRLRAGETVEVSTGLGVDTENESGFYNGREYEQVARNYRADHLAVLLKQPGACSVKDGCGCGVNNVSSKTGGSIMNQKNVPVPFKEFSPMEMALNAEYLDALNNLPVDEDEDADMAAPTHDDYVEEVRERVANEAKMRGAKFIANGVMRRK